MEAVEEDVGQQNGHAQARAVGCLVGHGHEPCCLGLLLGRHQLGGSDECAGVQVPAGNPCDDDIACSMQLVSVSMLSSGHHHEG